MFRNRNRNNLNTMAVCDMVSTSNNIGNYRNNKFT